jgi:hypothetical protein
MQPGSTLLSNSTPHRHCSRMPLLLLQVYSDFESFFADKHNVQVVYRPADSADLMYYHAITRVRNGSWLQSGDCRILCL